MDTTKNKDLANPVLTMDQLPEPIVVPAPVAPAAPVAHAPSSHAPHAPYRSSSGPSSGYRPTQSSRPNRFIRRKVCRFCLDRVDSIDYKDASKLKRFVTERGKIIPRRITGTCAHHQRQLTVSIKRARTIAILPFTAE